VRDLRTASSLVMVAKSPHSSTATFMLSMAPGRACAATVKPRGVRSAAPAAALSKFCQCGEL
jgi:hypothetical protein